MSLNAGLQMLSVAMLAVLLVALYQLQRKGTDPHGRLDQFHHGYLVVLALIPWLPMQIVALLIGADDTYQHVRQLSKPFYRSPLHRLAHRLGVI